MLRANTTIWYTIGMYWKPGLLLVFSFVCLGILTNVSYAQTPESAATEQQVREEFADAPVMVDIARCESGLRHFTDAGTVLRGGYNNDMVGVFQLYEAVHTTAAEDLGHDITTLAGNLAYARHLYEQSGTTPWDASRSCWEDAVTATPTTNATDTQSATDAELREKIALLEQIISLLQTILTLRTHN